MGKKFNITLTAEQKETKSKVLHKPINFILGKEGTGKTMLGVNIALDLFLSKDNSYDQIIITRPAVATEDFGFLPGSLKDKLSPYLQPIFENIKDVLGDKHAKDTLDNWIEIEKVRIVPIAFTRGVSYSNAIVIVDEFQNCTKHQLEMIIGRLNKNSKLIFTGSVEQIDLKQKQSSSIELLDKIKDNEYVSFSNLTQNHRHAAVSSVLNDIRDEESEDSSN